MTESTAPSGGDRAGRSGRSGRAVAGWIAARIAGRIAGLVETTAVLSVVATVAGFLGAAAWWLDLAAHFRLQYLAILVIASAAAAVRRRRRSMAVFALAAALNAALVMPLFLPAPGSPGAGRSDGVRVRLFLANVNSVTGSPDRAVDAVRAAEPDVVVLEETSDRWRVALERLSPRFPHRVVASREDNFGIALLSRSAPVDHEVLLFGPWELPTIRARFSGPGGGWTLFATHPLPPVSRDRAAARDRHLAWIAACARDARSPVVVAGDLNATPWSRPFPALLRVGGLRDSARGHGPSPTWPAQIPPMRIPIDHCLHSPEIAAVARAIGPPIGSDHLPLIVDLEFPGPGS